ncbi:MAG: serine/threonine-protein kinase [Planctomycetota bacterium]
MSESTDGRADGAGARDPVETLLDDYLAARRQGHAPDLDAHVARAGARAAELRELIESAELLDDLKSARPRGLSLHTPQVLGDYRILAEIGRGGMGVVYEAEQITLGRRVAVKVLPPQALRGESRLNRFRREAQTAAKLHHTNIVPVFGVGEQDGVHYYVMQLIVGRPLDEVMRALRGEKADPERPRRAGGSTALSASSAAQALRAGGFAPSSESAEVEPGDATYYRSVATLGLQVAEALTYAHAQGTLHRDIKPANLILDAQGVLWITDFGLAKVMEDDSFTNSGDLVGTLQYMAPEQIGGHADERTDVHGLGLVLYELTTLQPAFAADSRGELVERVRNQEPPSAGRVRPGVPRDLETIIRKATANDPGHRYQAAVELRDDLERFLQDRPIRARRVSSIESGWRWCRRNRLLASVGAVAVLGLVSTAVVSVMGYASTRRALDRAEDNVALALAGFESVFARIVGPDMLRPDDDEEGDVVAPGVGSALSANDQELLVEILHFYDRLAESNAGNAAARQLTARAYQRVGEVHLQLGKPAEAVANYERSVRLYTELVHDGVAALGTLMQVENGLCRANFALGRDEFRALMRQARSPEEARSLGESPRSRYERATQLAESVLARGEAASAPTPLMRLECARAHEQLARPGRGYGRRGNDPTRRDGSQAAQAPREAQMSPSEHYRAAMQLHESLLAEDPENATYRHAAARACLAVARAALRRPGRDPERREEIAKLQERALVLLQPLAEQFPARPQYREALVMALTLLPPDTRGGRRFDRGAEPADPEQIERHKRAVEIADGLARDFAGVEDFVREYCETALKTANLILASEPAEGLALVRRAVAAADKALADRSERSPGTLLCEVAVRGSSLVLGVNPDLAAEVAQRAVTVAEAALAERGEDNGTHVYLGQARARLLQALWRSGRAEQASIVYEKVKAAEADRGGGEAIMLRLTAIEEFLRQGAAGAARDEARALEAILERVQTGRDREPGPRGRPGPGDIVAGVGRSLAQAYERLAELEQESAQDRAQDRERAASLRERYGDRHDVPRR